jgi:hypothetical protein
MRYAREFVTSTFVGGLLIVVPVYLAVLNVPFTQAIRCISRWGSGSRDLVAAMRKGETQVVARQ